jgi:hypothetical protein
MTIQEPIDRLMELPKDQEIMILDGFNGGGNPRTLNFGPTRRKIYHTDEDETTDCEGLVGESVIVLGSGCY